MKRWMILGSLVCSAGLAWAGTNAGKASIDLPSGAKLVGTAQMDAVHAFPEMTKSKNVQTEDIVGTGALDRVYETNKDYKATVGYFDSLVKNGSATQQSRSVTKTTTGWQLQLPDGGSQNIIVRNTRPTTIETVQTAGLSEQDTLRTNEQNQPNMKKPEMQQNQQNQRNLPNQPNQNNNQ